MALTSKHERDFTEVSCILFTLKKLNIRSPKFTNSSLFHKQIFSAKYELNYPSGYKIQQEQTHLWYRNGQTTKYQKERPPVASYISARGQTFF